MFGFPGYAVSELIHENERIRVYRGYTINSKEPVVIKALKEEAASQMNISRLMYEYETVRNLDIDGVVKLLKWEQSGQLFAIVMEDVGAVTLRHYMNKNSLGLKEFLELTAHLTELLGRIHRKGLIHRDLKPENIMIHPITLKAYIYDFSSATSVSSGGRNGSAPVNPAVSPEYMSPEQTGRLNVEIDQRSDIYSLGIIFYELLTGTLPIKAESPSEWIYAHMTQKPKPPAEVNPAIPFAVSEIILKMLEKSVENRYQNAYGLLWDLKECEKQLLQTGRIEPFPIGHLDVSSRLTASHELYGREMEINILKAAFESACKGGTGTILVSGYPGIGKTMLINKGLKHFVQGRGYFVTGKFDQLEKSIPYSPFAAAFGILVKQLLTESRERLDWWKKRILQAVGRSGAVITEIIPELELLIGKQPPVDFLAPKEAESRFFMVFAEFVRAFSWKNHPLVLFLDDLHWADHASIKLMKYLTEDAGISYLLVIGAFRENEVDDRHPLAKLIEEACNGNPCIRHISLMPLKSGEVVKLVAGTLNAEPEYISILAEDLYRKSGGNPFFLKQLLTLIYEEGLLYFDTQQGCWKWKLDDIKKLKPGEDVLELILRRLQRLPEDACEYIKLASCIGNRFDIETLSAVSRESPEEVIPRIMLFYHEGLIIPPENRKESPECSETGGSSFEFMHDRIQQAIYSLIPEEEKQKKHISIGRMLLRNLAGGSLEDKILTIMDHFNRSLELVNDPEERRKLAEYNLLAGRKAKAAAAFPLAVRYFRAGRQLLPQDAWERDYRLCYDLHLELAQAEYTEINIDTAEKLFDIVVEKARTELERAGVYSLKLQLYADVGEYKEAVRTGIRALEGLGVRLPLHPSKMDYIREFITYKRLMWEKNIEELYDLPDMSDPVQKMITELFIRLSYVTLTSYPDLYSFIVLKTGNHVVQYGNNETAPVGFLGYCITAGNILGDYESLSRYISLIIRLMKKYDRPSSHSMVYFVIGAFIAHWTMHAASDLEYLKKAALYGRETGDILTIGYAHCLLLETSFILGIPLEKIEEEIHEKNEIARRLKHESLAINVSIYEKVVSALRGRSEMSLTYGAAEFSRDELLKSAGRDKTSLATCYLYEMQLNYMAGNYREALSTIQKLEQISGAILGFMTSAEYNFYCSLTIAAFWKDMTPRERKYYFKMLKKKRRQMGKWAEACRENFEHKYLLIEAEIAKLENRKEEAMLFYDRAISSARENRYMQNEALAYELAARFYMQNGMERIAEVFMADAYQGYIKWGAFAKGEQLWKRYQKLLKGITVEKKDDGARIFENMPEVPASKDADAEKGLDMFLINKALESITAETEIGRLFEGFLDIAVQSTGADRGYLILEESNELIIEAIKDNGSCAAVAKTIQLEEYNKISKGVVRYVARTLETVVLNCGDTSGIFAGDPYIAETNPGSIACLPLLFQGIPFGVLYLENSFIPGVFAEDRLEALKLLSAQIAYAKKLQSYLEGDTPQLKEEQDSELIDPLTDREKEVLKLIAAGLSNKEIAERLDMTVNTVKTHIKNIYGKLHVNRRVQVAAKAKRLEII